MSSSNKLMMRTKMKPIMVKGPKFVQVASADSLMSQSSSSKEPTAAKSYHQYQTPAPSTSPMKIAILTPAQKKLDRLIQKKPQNQVSFLSSTPDRKAMSDLTHTQPKLDQNKENICNAASTVEASAGKKARRASPKTGKINNLRRIVMPMPGQKNVERLKRIDL